jgi:hypothetical protein
MQVNKIGSNGGRKPYNLGKGFWNRVQADPQLKSKPQFVVGVELQLNMARTNVSQDKTP